MKEDTPTYLIILSSFSFMSLLLWLGHFIRIRVRLLSDLFLPASLIGGLIGLLCVQLLSLSDAAREFLQHEVTAGWEEVPNFLICIVFGTLFMGSRIPPLGQVWQVSGPQLMYGQIVAWGQYAIPALATAVILIPALDTNKLIAPVVALGFEGGHGTAAGIKASFVKLEYPAGGDLALCAATIGLISGVLLGTFVINLAARRNWVTTIAPDNIVGMYPETSRPPAGYQVIPVDAIDSFALHLLLRLLSLRHPYQMSRCAMLSHAQTPCCSSNRRVCLAERVRLLQRISYVPVLHVCRHRRAAALRQIR
eukprot:TRINITY_DN10874_c0_g1_i10.p1 TRINITY_DN10874_c0_g1~~TRINITY_DN10874_c0_g1_i10.p1  ORF type:complete len:308 (+),score=11.13 TRINITY_DN10874_c0_g1_i10:78-1001(+)